MSDPPPITPPPATRRHPDVFSGPEALQYLGLPAEAERTLETLRAEHELRGVRIGKDLFYHRRELDTLVARLFGLMATRAPAGDVAGRVGRASAR